MGHAAMPCVSPSPQHTTRQRQGTVLQLWCVRRLQEWDTPQCPVCPPTPNTQHGSVKAPCCSCGMCCALAHTTAWGRGPVPIPVYQHGRPHATALQGTLGLCVHGGVAVTGYGWGLTPPETPPARCGPRWGGVGTGV